MASSATAPNTRVRTLNDLLRRHQVGGQVVLTPGVLALGLDLLLLIDDAVSRFDAFTPDNDPYGEHDFGLVRVKAMSSCSRSTPTTWRPARALARSGGPDRDLPGHDPDARRRVLTGRPSGGRIATASRRAVQLQWLCPDGRSCSPVIGRRDHPDRR